MATTYYADVLIAAPSTVIQGTAANFPGPVVVEGGNDVTVPFTFTVADNLTAGDFLLGAADIIALVNIPAGATITDFYLSIPELDDGSNALTLDLGLTTTDENCFLSASTVGQAGGVVSTVNAIAGSIPYAQVAVAGTYPAVAQKLMGDVFALQVGVASNSGVATGVIHGYVRYTMLGQLVF